MIGPAVGKNRILLVVLKLIVWLKLMSNKLIDYPLPKYLPPAGSDLADYARFASSFDPTSAFRDLWSKDYASRSMDLWALGILEFNEKNHLALA